MYDAGSLTTATTSERAHLALALETSHVDFCRFFFKRTFSERFQVGPHHELIARHVVDPLLRMELDPPRVIINIPPGYTKTMEVVIMFVARALGLFPSARFIHTSFSDTLVADNSTNIRDIILGREYQALWPMAVRNDVGKKGLWRTTAGGGMLAAPAKGTITGFRAGRLNKDEFTGALIIDDPLKPDDAFSKAERQRVNMRFNNTMRSRLAHEGVPIIVVMQRLHQDDLSGFLLKGGSGDYWHHLNLPVMIDNAAAYPAEYTHGIPIDHGLPDGPLWDVKHDRRQIEILKADEFVFAAQYMQNPMALGGAIFRREHLQFHTSTPNLLYRTIYADTAQKDDEQHDYSVFQCWGFGADRKAYLLDQMRGKWKAPELKANAEAFWAKHLADKANGRGTLRAMKIEDKVSGTYLLQSLKGIPVIGIERDTRDKVMRAMDVAPSFAAGLVSVPKDAPWLPDYISELLSFPGGDHDDQVDPTVDAIKDMIGTGSDLLRLLG